MSWSNNLSPIGEEIESIFILNNLNVIMIKIFNVIKNFNAIDYY